MLIIWLFYIFYVEKLYVIDCVNIMYVNWLKLFDYVLDVFVCKLDMVVNRINVVIWDFKYSVLLNCVCDVIIFNIC